MLTTESPLLITVYCHPEPQGSSKGFLVKGRAIITSANAQMKPYRHIVTQTAMSALHKAGLTWPLRGKHEPVKLALAFFFQKPPSVSKKRTMHVVKPDIDKLTRATMDALTGVLYLDDAQVVQLTVTKMYDDIERVVIGVIR